MLLAWRPPLQLTRTLTSIILFNIARHQTMSIMRRQLRRIHFLTGWLWLIRSTLEYASVEIAAASKPDTNRYIAAATVARSNQQRVVAYVGSVVMQEDRD